MHILLIHQAFVSREEAGGTRHYELARALVHQGHRVTVITSLVSYLTGQIPPSARRRWLVRERLEGIDVWRTWTYPALHRSFFWRIVSFFTFMLASLCATMKVGPVDLVMGTSPPIFQAVSARLAASLRRRPFLLEIRDLWPDFAIDIGVLRNSLLIAASRWLERFLYASATHILVNSPAYREYLLKKGIPDTEISLISNGVDPDLFDPRADGRDMRQELDLHDKFLVAYTGAMGMANDIGTILRAAARLRDEPTIHFLLVGDGKERRSLERQAQSLALSNVTFIGARPKTDMPDILAASDTCVAILKDIPMFRTTYPNKVFDYMAAARPTILAIDGVIREVVEKASGGIFVPPGDDEALADAVRSLAEHPREAQAMGASARTYVTEHFNRRGQAVQFARLLEHVA